MQLTGLDTLHELYDRFHKSNSNDSLRQLLIVDIGLEGP
jgi:hypothetical protein